MNYESKKCHQNPTVGCCSTDHPAEDVAPFQSDVNVGGPDGDPPYCTVGTVLVAYRGGEARKWLWELLHAVRLVYENRWPEQADGSKGKSEMRGQDTELVRALNLGAEGREEYAERSTREDHRQFLLGEAAAFRSAARLIESGNVNHFLASALPSWRWSKEVDAYVMRENPRLNDGGEA